MSRMNLWFGGISLLCVGMMGMFLTYSSLRGLESPSRTRCLGRLEEVELAANSAISTRRWGVDCLLKTARPNRSLSQGSQ